MKLSLNYTQLIEKNLTEELLWFGEEFAVLFANKKRAKNDLVLANQLLRILRDNFAKSSGNKQIFDLFTKTMDNIGNHFPEFF